MAATRPSPLTVARWTACRPYHIEHAGGETEQQEHDQPPRRDAEPAVEPPADQGADEDAGDELGRKPHPARHAGSDGRRVFRRRRAARPVTAEFLAETPQ